MGTPEILFGPQGPLLMMQSDNGSRYAITMGDDGSVGVQRYYDEQAGEVGLQSLYPNIQGAGDDSSDLEASSTDDVDFVTKLMFEQVVDVESKFRIEWYFESTCDTNKRWCEVRVLLNGADVLGGDEYYPNKTGLWQSSMGFSTNVLAAGTHVIAIQYRSQDKPGIAKVKNARIHVTKS